MDLDRNSVQNALSFAPVALMAIPFVDLRCFFADVSGIVSIFIDFVAFCYGFSWICVFCFVDFCLPEPSQTHQELYQTLPELSQTLPKLAQGLPGLTQGCPEPPGLPGGGSSRLKCSILLRLRTKNSLSELSGGSSISIGSTGSSGSGGSKRATDPAFHTHRGPG